MSGAVATVDLGAIARNIVTIRSITPSTVMAVVKADAFGHGAAEVARAALAAGASQLGVTSLEEAHALRSAGIAAPILSWLNGTDAAWGAALRDGIDVAVSSITQLEGLAASARATGGRAHVHLHADTGMAREGAPAQEWARLCARAAKLEREGALAVCGVMGHLACADDPHEAASAAAVEQFDWADRVARAAGLGGYVRHLAASSAVLAVRARSRVLAGRCSSGLTPHYDMVRIGAAMVGIDSHATGMLEGAMSLQAPVLSVRWAEEGTGVGYDHTEHLARGSYLALVPVGYADGVPRSSAGTASVWVGGRRAPIVGRVSMDSVVVDVGPTCPPRPGELATVFGPGAAGEPTVDEWARWAGTIPHEIVTGLGPRVSRRWVNPPREDLDTRERPLVGTRP